MLNINTIGEYYATTKRRILRGNDSWNRLFWRIQWWNNSRVFARPITESIKGGVLVIFEAFGMVEHTKELVRKFAANGYYSIAPDLYWRDGYVDPVDMRAVRKAMGELPDTQAIADMQAATNFLKNQPNCSWKIGVIGHCSGVRHSMLFACNSDAKSAVFL